MLDLLTISEVPRRSGVAASALRFYEERGLIESERAGSGHRRFARAVLRRIAFIVFAQKIGLSLDEIAGELARLPGEPGTAARRLGAPWRVAGPPGSTTGSPNSNGCARRSRSASAADACRSRSARCRIPGDRAKRLGPGPRYWIDADDRTGRGA